MRNVILRSLTWPLFIGTLLAWIIKLIWGESGAWNGNGVYIVRLREGTWFAKKYAGWGGTTFGFGIIVTKTADDAIIAHEMVHVEQFEDATVGGFFLGLIALAIVHSWWGIGALFACWMLAVWAVYFSGTLVAWLRSEPNAYRGNAWEEAARAITQVTCTPNKAS